MIRLLRIAMVILVLAPPARAAEDPRPARLGSTFIQLTRAHQEWPVSRWEELFRQFRTLSLTEVVVQWSRYDDQTFYDTSPRRAGGAPITTILRLADEAGIKVWLGLASDSQYWAAIEREPRVVDVYLRQLRLRSLEVARQLHGEARTHTSFAGWYLPEEIDDVNWVEPQARRALLDHLQAEAAELSRISPKSPLALSGFSNGNMEPAVLALMWSDIATVANLSRVLFQDGVGAGKLDVADLPPYLDALARAMAATHREFGVVVELFRQTSAVAPFVAVAAPIDRVVQQLKAARAYTDIPIVGFAVPDYLSPSGGVEAARLYNEYLRATELRD